MVSAGVPFNQLHNSVVALCTLLSSHTVCSKLTLHGLQCKLLVWLYDVAHCHVEI